MSVVENGDFSDGLNGWSVSSAGDTGPTYDADNGWVVFGTGNNDVQDGDRLEQTVGLTAGQEYTLSFTMTELGSSFGGFGLNVELIGDTGTQFLTFAQVSNDDTTTVNVSFTSDYDDPLLRIRGGFGFGGVDSSLILDDFVLICFGRGTLIETADGSKRIENISVGDLVQTRDEGLQPVRWTGSRHVSAHELRMNPALRPVRINQNTFGHGLPAYDLITSKAHRVMLKGLSVELVLDQSECLAAAAALARWCEGVNVQKNPGDWPDGVEYFHLLFDRHQIITSNGLHTESFHPATRTISTFDAKAREEILTLFPELEMAPTATALARPQLRSFEIPTALGIKAQ